MQSYARKVPLLLVGIYSDPKERDFCIVMANSFILSFARIFHGHPRKIWGILRRYIHYLAENNSQLAHSTIYILGHIRECVCQHSVGAFRIVMNVAYDHHVDCNTRLQYPLVPFLLARFANVEPDISTASTV
jgi:hypothetical protein